MPSKWSDPPKKPIIKFDAKAKEAFLLEYAKENSRAKSAEAAGVSRNTVNYHLARDPEFAAAVEELKLPKKPAKKPAKKSASKPRKPARKKPPRLCKNGKSRQSPTPTRRNPVVDQTNWRVQIQQRRIKFDDATKRIYLEEFAKHSMKGTAAEVAGVCLNTVNNHLDNDPEFAAAYEAAFQSYRDKRVDKAMELAFEGNLRERYDKEGNLIESWREHSVPLIQMELRRVDGDFRDKQTVDHNVKGGVMVKPAPMSESDWKASEEADNTDKQAPPKMIELQAQDVTNVS